MRLRKLIDRRRCGAQESDTCHTPPSLPPEESKEQSGRFDVLKCPQYQFRHSRMYVHALVDAVYTSAACHSVYNFLDKLWSIGPYDVKAQYPSVVSVNYGLGKAFLFHHGLTFCGIEVLRPSHKYVGILFGILLGQSHRGNLRVRVNCVRRCTVVHLNLGFMS